MVCNSFDCRTGSVCGVLDPPLVSMSSVRCRHTVALSILIIERLIALFCLQCAMQTMSLLYSILEMQAGKVAWSGRVGSQDGDVMGLCDRACDFPPCIVQIEENCETKVCNKWSDTYARLQSFLTFFLSLYCPLLLQSRTKSRV